MLSQYDYCKREGTERSVCCLLPHVHVWTCNLIDRGVRAEGGIKKNEGYRALGFYIIIEPHFHFKDF